MFPRMASGPVSVFAGQPGTQALLYFVFGRLRETETQGEALESDACGHQLECLASALFDGRAARAIEGVLAEAVHA